MTQPLSYPTPPVGGPLPTTGGVAPQPGPHRLHHELAEAVVVKVSP
ncbi:hypothetical protein [Micromonospora sp. NPDC005220]